MTEAKFKKYVRNKFGSVQRFLHITKTKQMEIDNASKAATPIKKRRAFTALLKKAKKEGRTIIAYRDLTPELLESIRVKIYTTHKSQIAFCDEHRISNTWLSALLRGKYKRLSTNVKHLLTILQIETPEQK